MLTARQYPPLEMVDDQALVSELPRVPPTEKLSRGRVASGYALPKPADLADNNVFPTNMFGIANNTPLANIFSRPNKLAGHRAMGRPQKEDLVEKKHSESLRSELGIVLDSDGASNSRLLRRVQKQADITNNEDIPEITDGDLSLKSKAIENCERVIEAVEDDENDIDNEVEIQHDKTPRERAQEDVNTRASEHEDVSGLQEEPDHLASSYQTESEAAEQEAHSVEHEGYPITEQDHPARRGAFTERSHQERVLSPKNQGHRVSKEHNTSTPTKNVGTDEGIVIEDDISLSQEDLVALFLRKHKHRERLLSQLQADHKLVCAAHIEANAKCEAQNIELRKVRLQYDRAVASTKDVEAQLNVRNHKYTDLKAWSEKAADQHKELQNYTRSLQERCRVIEGQRDNHVQSFDAMKLDHEKILQEVSRTKQDLAKCQADAEKQVSLLENELEHARTTIESATEEKTKLDTLLQELLDDKRVREHILRDTDELKEAVARVSTQISTRAGSELEIKLDAMVEALAILSRKNGVVRSEDLQAIVEALNGVRNNKNELAGSIEEFKNIYGAGQVETVTKVVELFKHVTDLKPAVETFVQIRAEKQALETKVLELKRTLHLAEQDKRASQLIACRSIDKDVALAKGLINNFRQSREDQRLQETNSQLHTRLMTANSSVVKLEKELGDARIARENVEKHLNKVCNDLALAIASQNKNSETEVGDLHKSLYDKQTEIDGRAAEVQQSQEKLDEVQAQNRKAGRIASEQAQALLEQSTELANTQKDLRQAHEQLTMIPNLEAVVSSLQRQISSYVDTDRDLVAAQSEILDLQTKLHEQAAKADILERQLGEAQNELSLLFELRTRCESLQADNATKDNKLRNLDQALSELDKNFQSAKEKLESDLDNIKAQKDQLHKKNQKLEDEVLNLEGVKFELNEAKKLIEEKQRELADKRDLEAAHNKLREDHQLLQQSLEALEKTPEDRKSIEASLENMQFERPAKDLGITQLKERLSEPEGASYVQPPSSGQELDFDGLSQFSENIVLTQAQDVQSVDESYGYDADIDSVPVARHTTKRQNPRQLGDSQLDSQKNSSDPDNNWIVDRGGSANDLASSSLSEAEAEDEFDEQQDKYRTIRTGTSQARSSQKAPTSHQPVRALQGRPSTASSDMLLRSEAVSMSRHRISSSPGSGDVQVPATEYGLESKVSPLKTRSGLQVPNTIRSLNQTRYKNTEAVKSDDNQGIRHSTLSQPNTSLKRQALIEDSQPMAPPVKKSRSVLRSIDRMKFKKTKSAFDLNANIRSDTSSQFEPSSRHRTSGSIAGTPAPAPVGPARKYQKSRKPTTKRNLGYEEAFTC